MSTLRTSNLIHGSSSVSNVVLDTQGRASFGPDGPNGRAALYVDPQNNRVGVNTESPAVALDVDGAINTTGNLTVGGTFNFTGDLTVSIINSGAGTAAAPSVSVGTTDNGLYSPGTDQVAISTNGTQRLAIDSSGRLLVGTSTSYSQGGFIPSLQQHANSSAGTGIYRWAGASTGGAILGLTKSRGASTGTNSIVFNNDSLGTIIFSGDDGTNLNTPAAFITAEVDGVPGVNDMPGRLVFSTTADGASSPTERLRIDSTGNATFTGTVSTGTGISGTGASIFADGRVYGAVYRAEDGGGSGILFQGNVSAVEKFRVDTAGSATFAGVVYSGGNAFNGAADGSRLSPGGSIYASAPSGTLWGGYTTGSSAFTSSISADGSAAFANNTFIGAINLGSTTATGFLFVPQGLQYVQRPASSPNEPVYQAYKGTANTLTLNCDGSASFAGRINAGTSEPNNYAIVANNNTSDSTATINAQNNGAGWILDLRNSSGTVVSVLNDGSATFKGAIASNRSAGNVWEGYQSSSITSQINANGSVIFAGNVTANGTVLTSDQRFKENITPANPQLADIKALGAQLKNYDWNADAPSSNGTRQLGLIAQDVEAVCPGIVKTIARTKQGAELTPEVVVPAVYETRTVPAVLDNEGKVVKAETTEQVLVTEEQITPATYEELDDSYKGISHDALIMKLLGAVAELSAKVAALEAG